MFNLEKAIARWRDKMSAAGIKIPVPLDELELHLREDIEELVASGRSEADAFVMAVQKLGQAEPLQNDFRKNEEARIARKSERALRAVRVLMILFGLGLVVAVLLKPGNLSQCNSAQQAWCLVAIFIYSLPLWSVRLNAKIAPAIRDKRRRDAVGVFLGAFVLLWFVLLAYVIEPRFELDMGQLIVAIIWSMIVPLGLSSGIVFGIEAAALRNLKSVDTQILQTHVQY